MPCARPPPPVRPCSPSSSSLFRELGGLRIMVQRLKYEVEQPAEPAAAGAAGGAAAGAAADATQAGAAAAGGSSAGAAAAGDKPARVVPYSRRLLLKSLLRAIAIASYSPGGCRTSPLKAQAARRLALPRAPREMVAPGSAPHSS